jgi:signal transduction histidine kinase
MRRMEGLSTVGTMSFAGYAAHELRTPLTMQRALLELGLADPHADVAAWREIGENVLAACKQQERLLEACLTLARSECCPKRREPVDLAAIVEQTLRAQDHGGLERLVDLAPAVTSGDANLLERLVANLISNAIRHNVPRGWIEIETRTAAGRAHLAVANTGQPIARRELQRLFQPFQRRDANAAEGVGLGLAIVRAVADAHEARVAARPRIGGGLAIDVVFHALA